MTSVERFVNGFPDNPPTSTLFSDVNPSREMVVLVAITPAILVSFTISIISNNCSFVKSGAIFRRIGLTLTFVLFNLEVFVIILSTVLFLVILANLVCLVNLR